MRKPRRLSFDELAPYVWDVPGLRKSRPVESEAPPAVPSTIDWPALFGNANPVEIEVGMGKGQFLLNAATTRPEVNFLGIEIVRKYQLYATTRFASRRLPNAKTACADAKIVLQKHVRPQSIAAVHVYFPDPWWKQRHRKRRVFSPEFACLAATVLPVGGRLHIATDVPEYFGVMMGIVRAMPAFREQIAAEPSAEAVTNFEKKARKKGIAIDRALFERTDGPITLAIDPSETD